MESFQLLMNGFAIALQPTYLFFAFMGCLIGTVVGVLPGVGPLTGTAVLIPITFVLDATGSIIMLSAIYYGAMYGGTITSVLINTPGEAASAVTCIEGYPMAKQGRGGAALASAAIGSFIGGTVAVFALVLVALPLTSVALKFGPPEFFCLMLVGLTLVTGLAGKSISLAMISAVFGLLLGLVGMDPVFGAPRFTFGYPELLDGVGLVPVAMGLFGVGEVLLSLEKIQPGGDTHQNEFVSFVAAGSQDYRRTDRSRHGYRAWPRLHTRRRCSRAHIHVLRGREEGV